MNIRDITIKTLLYQSPEKIPLDPGQPRKSTLERWASEGLPEGVHWWDYVCEKIKVEIPKPGPIPQFRTTTSMIPMFKEEVLEHKDGHYIIRDWMGSILEISDKYDYTYIRNAIDFVTRRWIKCPVENRDDWDEMKSRYVSDAPERVSVISPGDVQKINSRDSYLMRRVNGPFWQLREWMGFEGLCEAFIERPDFVAEMIEFWQEHVIKVFQRMFAQGVTVDCIGISEDMAYKAHSMISPAMTREFLLPVYKKWITFFKANGVKLFNMDSDGYVADLTPIWIEAGINVSEPVEVAAHNDILLYHEQFGTSMAYIGGIDKRAMAAGGRVIEDELKRVAPLIGGKGGFIPSCDHGVPPDVSLDNYIRYARLLAGYTRWL